MTHPQIYYGVRRAGTSYYPWIDGATLDDVPCPSFAAALGLARREGWKKSSTARIECYQGDNAQHFEKAKHFEVYDEYRKKIG